MLSLRKHRSTSIIWQLTASFLLILLIPVICNLLIYFEIRKDIQDELNQKNAILFQNIQRSLELTLNEYPQSVSELVLDPTMMAVSSLEDPSALTPELEDAFVQSMKPYYQTMFNAYKFYCYFDNIARVGTSAGFQDPDSFFSVVYDGLDLEYSDWQKWVSSPTEELWMVKGTGTLTDVAPKYILMKYRMNDNAVMVVMLRDVFLSYRIDKALNNSKINYEIFSRDNQLLSTTLSSDTASAGLTAQMTGQSGMFASEVEGTPVIVNYSVIASNGWKLVFYTPEKLFDTGRNSMRLVLLMMLAAILVGCLFIPWLVRRQYTPVRKILSRLPSGIKEAGTDRKNEYTRIESALVKSAQQRQSLQQEHRRNVQNDFWLKILNGVFTNFSEEDIKEYRKPYFTAMPTMVGVLPMDGYVNLFNEDEMPNYERFSLFLTVLDNVGRELLQEHGIESFFLESGGNCVILLQVKTQAETEQLQAGLQEFLDKMREYFHMDLCIAVSKWYDDLFDLSRAYSEALTGLDYIQFTEETDLLFYEDIDQNQPCYFSLKTEESNALCKLIKYGEYDKACAYVDDLLYRFTHSASFSPIILKYYIHDIINTITKNFQSYVVDDSREINDLYVLTLSTTTDIQAVKNSIYRLLHSICTKVRIELENFEDNRGKVPSLALAEDIRDYIDAHYADPELCANMISQEFHVSPPYISKVFKAIEPDGFLNYIITKRIEKAKELLRFTSKKIGDISAETGFSNLTSFIRLFKKIEGVPPGTYRKANTGGEE